MPTIKVSGSAAIPADHAPHGKFFARRFRIAAQHEVNGLFSAQQIDEERKLRTFYLFEQQSRS